jgi:hypothetical protein
MICYPQTTFQTSSQTAIDNQTAKFASIEQDRPAWPASKQTRAAWDNQLTQLKGRILQLEQRSERVGEVT